MGAYRELIVWQCGMELVERIYAFVRTLPADERFGLSSQLTRAAVSIPSNIAEGNSRRSVGAYLNHVSIAIGSQAEIETLLDVCRRLSLGDETLRTRCVDRATETGRLLHGLHAALQRSSLHKRLLLYSTILIAPGLWHLASDI